MATGLKPALAVALGHFLFGLLCIVQPAQYPAANFWLLPDGNGSHLVLALPYRASTGTGGNSYRYRRHLRRHCGWCYWQEKYGVPRHAGREQLDRAEGIMEMSYSAGCSLYSCSRRCFSRCSVLPAGNRGSLRLCTVTVLLKLRIHTAADSGTLGGPNCR